MVGKDIIDRALKLQGRNQSALVLEEPFTLAMNRRQLLIDGVPVTPSETTLLLLSLQSTDEAANPQNLFPIEPDVVAQTLSLNRFSQARLRSRVTGPGTSGVTGTLEYTADVGGSWAALLTNTIDFSQAAQTTAWEDIPAGALGAETFVGMRVVMAGAGTATPTLTLILDLRAG